MNRKTFAVMMVAVASTAMAGPLNPPPGPIVSTMKSLAEVEPRIAINATNTPGDVNSVFTITQPGSYYLPSNITGASGKYGIFVSAPNVTIDLNGFAVQGVAGSTVGIAASAGNITVKNGVVTGWGSSGIALSTESRVSEVTSRMNGGTGISVGRGSVVESCIATSNTSKGIYGGDYAVIRGCTAARNNTGGIDSLGSARVEECLANENGGDGISVGNSGVAIRCNSDDNAGSGIVASDQSSVRDCSTATNTRDGIQVGYGVQVTGCTSFVNTGHGISAGSGCLIEGNMCRYNGSGAGLAAGVFISPGTSRSIVKNNTVTGNDYGIKVDSANNLILGNGSSSNSINFEIVAGNRVSIILTLSTSAAISGGAGGTTITSPDANYSY